MKGTIFDTCPFSDMCHDRSGDWTEATPKNERFKDSLLISTLFFFLGKN